MLFPLKLWAEKGTDENLTQLMKYGNSLFQRVFPNNKSKSKFSFECKQLNILKYLQMCHKPEVNLVLWLYCDFF